MSTIENKRESAASSPRAIQELLLAVGFFLVWTVATWFFEGRVHTLLRADAVGARMTYALGVNIVLGIGGGAVLLGVLLRKGAVELEAAGLTFKAIKTPLMILTGAGIGGFLYWVQGAPSWHPVVLANAFAQVLVVSIAEVLVCWVVLASVIRSSLDRLPNWATYILASMAASILFGLYHFAHSPPFNTWMMVGVLTVVGLMTSAFFFISRDVWGTVVFHNALAVYGVVGALAAQDGLATFHRPVWPLFGTAVVACAALIGAQVWLRKHA